MSTHSPSIRNRPRTFVGPKAPGCVRSPSVIHTPGSSRLDHVSRTSVPSSGRVVSVREYQYVGAALADGDDSGAGVVGVAVGCSWAGAPTDHCAGRWTSDSHAVPGA